MRMPRLRTCLTGLLLTVIALTTSAAAPSAGKVVRIGWYPDLYNCISTNGIKTGYWSAATKEVLAQKLAAYENTGYEPDEIRAAIEQAAKNSETKTATIMAECIAGAMKDTLGKYGTAGSGKKGETP